MTLRAPAALHGLAVVAAVSCAAPVAPPAPVPPPPSAEPASARDGAPRYRPSAGSTETLPITSDAYGAYAAAESAPHLGDTLEDFALPLADGGEFSLAQARAAGPVVVMFYRGFW